jgi:hypothetical protein
MSSFCAKIPPPSSALLFPSIFELMIFTASGVPVTGPLTKMPPPPWSAPLVAVVLLTAIVLLEIVSDVVTLE